MNSFAIAFKDNSPLYYQLYSHIISQILAGRLLENQRLPSKRVLAANLAVSQNTVDSAYQMLVAEGYVVARPKSGFYVCPLDSLTIIPEKPLPLKQPVAVPPLAKYNFSTGNVDAALFPFKTWARISREVMAYGDSLLNHGDRQGDLVLRQSISAYLHEFRGVRCSPEQLVVGAGVEYIIGLLAQLLGKEAVIGIENPGYAKISQIFNNNGSKIRQCALDQKGVSPDSLQRQGCTAAYITPSHQFPTGITMPVGRRLELLNWCKQGDGRYIIEDDYDSEFRFDGRPIPSLQGLDNGASTIYLSTFSKSLAPSIRIAYMVLPPALLTLYQQGCGFYSSTVSRFEQHTLSRFIEYGHLPRHINRARNMYKARKDVLVHELQAGFGHNVCISHENMGLHLPVRFDLGLCEDEIVSRAAACEISLTALGSFYPSNPPPNLPSTIIFGYSGITKEKIPTAIAALAQGLKTPIFNK